MDFSVFRLLWQSEEKYKDNEMAEPPFLHLQGGVMKKLLFVILLFSVYLSLECKAFISLTYNNRILNNELEGFENYLQHIETEYIKCYRTSYEIRNRWEINLSKRFMFKIDMIFASLDRIETVPLPDPELFIGTDPAFVWHITEKFSFGIKYSFKYFIKAGYFDLNIENITDGAAELMFMELHFPKVEIHLGCSWIPILLNTSAFLEWRIFKYLGTRVGLYHCPNAPKLLDPVGEIGLIFYFKELKAMLFWHEAHLGGKIEVQL